jgi:hypothetical protein
MVLLPNELPGRNQEPNMEFLMSGNCFVLEVVAVFRSDDAYSVSLEVVGCVHNDNCQVFQKGQKLFVVIEAEEVEKQLLVVVPNSNFASCLDHLGSLDASTYVASICLSNFNK